MASARNLWAKKLSASLESGKVFSKKNKTLSGKNISSESAVKSVSQFYGTILGIDPSLRGTGLAVIRLVKGGKPQYLKSKTVKNKQDLSFAECIRNIFLEVENILSEFEVDCVAIEQTIYVQNNKVAMSIGSARGAAIAAAACRNKEIFEYPPLRIKQAVVGYGRASKEQVSKTMQALLEGVSAPLSFDEADAAAAALAHAYTKGRNILG